MQNDADHNVTRMNLGQAARQQSSTKRPAVQVAATSCGVDLKPVATFIAPIRSYSTVKPRKSRGKSVQCAAHDKTVQLSAHFCAHFCYARGAGLRQVRGGSRSELDTMVAYSKMQYLLAAVGRRSGRSNAEKCMGTHQLSPHSY